MDSLTTRWNSLSLPMKALTLLGLPLVLAFLIFEAWGKVSSLEENSDRKAVDEKSKQISVAQAQTTLDTAKEEGKLEQLEADKAKDVQNADTQDPASFYNDRKPT